MPEIIDILLSRRSIRQFTPGPVDRETLIRQCYQPRKRRPKVKNARHLP